MVYKFRFLSDESDSFLLDVEIKGDQTFFDLHKSMQAALGYDPTQLCSFFTTDESWEKQQEITLLEMTDDAVVMDVAQIDEFLKSKKQRLLYVFDYFTERSLFGAITEITGKNQGMELPKVTRLVGTPPKQNTDDNQVDTLIDTISEN